MLDYRYATAFRHAANAWAHGHVTDSLAQQQMRRQRTEDAQTRAVTTAPGVRRVAKESVQAMNQPSLARFGNLGTRLNLFA